METDRLIPLDSLPAARVPPARPSAAPGSVPRTYRPKRPTVVTTCASCGCEVRRQASQVKYEHVYCSRACYEAGETKRVTKPCATCGKLVTRPVCQMRGEKVYCSPACSAIGKQVRVIVPCDGCGCPVTRTAGHLKRDRKEGRRVFCSRKCAARHNTGKDGHGVRWKGGRYACSNGYVTRDRRTFTEVEQQIIRPMLGAGQERVAEHRAIAALAIGRPLDKNEHVHHRNGDKSDNRPENLEVYRNGDHRLEHAKVIQELKEARRVNELLTVLLLNT